MPNVKQALNRNRQKKNHVQFHEEEHRKSHSHRPEQNRHFVGQNQPIAVLVPHQSGKRGK